VRKRALLAGALALAALPAAAQFGGRRRGGMAGGDKGGGAAEGGGAREPTPVLETTLHEFQQDLKLTAEQQPLFERYAESIRALGRDVLRERSPAAAAAKLAVLQRIDRNVDALRNRLAALEEIADAAKALYAKLAAEQQAAADPRLATIMLLPLNTGDARKPPARG
jgi:hypothetical protein